MTTLPPDLFDSALAAIQGALEPRRIYANDPRVSDKAVTDYHELCFRELIKRDPQLARAAQRPVVFEDEGRDAAEFFAAEQCPSDATFR